MQMTLQVTHGDDIGQWQLAETPLHGPFVYNIILACDVSVTIW